MDEEKHKCPPHFWIIDVEDVGRCKYCPAVKDFGKELAQSLRKHKLSVSLGSFHSPKKGARKT